MKSRRTRKRQNDKNRQNATGLGFHQISINFVSFYNKHGLLRCRHYYSIQPSISVQHLSLLVSCSTCIYLTRYCTPKFWKSNSKFLPMNKPAGVSNIESHMWLHRWHVHVKKHMMMQEFASRLLWHDLSNHHELEAGVLTYYNNPITITNALSQLS